VIWVRRESKYFCGQDWTGSISLIRFDNSSPARRSANPRAVARTATVKRKSVPNAAAPEDSESFNQLVRTIPLRTKGCVMSNLDRVSGSFLAVIVGGLAVLCGGLIVIAIGY
jgi:hypothetical protein